MALNLHLRIVRMVHFMFCVLYHSKNAFMFGMLLKETDSLTKKTWIHHSQRAKDCWWLGKARGPWVDRGWAGASQCHKEDLVSVRTWAVSAESLDGSTNLTWMQRSRGCSRRPGRMKLPSGTLQQSQWQSLPEEPYLWMTCTFSPPGIGPWQKGKSRLSHWLTKILNWPAKHWPIEKQCKAHMEFYIV